MLIDTDDGYESLCGFFTTDAGVQYVIDGKTVTRSDFAAWINTQDAATRDAMRPLFNSLCN